MGESVAALALVLLLATAAPAQDRAEHLIPSLTNSAMLTAVWSEQVAYPGCGFTGWQNVPVGLETNESLVFALEAAWTNARATFAVPIEPLMLGTGAGEAPTLTLQPWRTARVQQCEGSLTNTDWQDVGVYGYGETNWTDTTATGAWRSLFYRLAQ